MANEKLRKQLMNNYMKNGSTTPKTTSSKQTTTNRDDEDYNSLRNRLVNEAVNKGRQNNINRMAINMYKNGSGNTRSDSAIGRQPKGVQQTSAENRYSRTPERNYSEPVARNERANNPLSRASRWAQDRLKGQQTRIPNIDIDKIINERSVNTEAVKELKRRINMEMTAGDSPTLKGIARNKGMTEAQAFQELENAESREKEQKFTKDRLAKRTQLENVQDHDFEKVAAEGIKIADRNSGDVNVTANGTYNTQDTPDIFLADKNAYKIYQKLDENEKKTFGYYLAKDGYQAAKDYLNTIERDVNERTMNEETERLKELATDNPVTAWAGARAANIAAGMGTAETVKQRAKNILTGSDAPLDVNAPGYWASNASQAITEQQTENIKNPALQFAYQTGSSIADNLIQMGLGAAVGAGAATLGGISDALQAEETIRKFTDAVSLPIMATGAASSATREAVENGATTDQAVQLGIVSGIAEYATEKIGMDNLMDVWAEGGKNGLTTLVKDTIKASGKAAVPEGLEEVVSDIVNNIAEDMILGEDSKFNKTVREYMTEGGMTEQEARSQAMVDRVKDTAMSFLGGFVSGGIMGGVGYAMNAVGAAKTGNITRNTEGFEGDFLTKQANELGGQAKEMAQGIDANNLTDYQAGMLQNQVAAEVAQRAEENGITEEEVWEDLENKIDNPESKTETKNEESESKPASVVETEETDRVQEQLENHAKENGAQTAPNEARSIVDAINEAKEDLTSEQKEEIIQEFADRVHDNESHSPEEIKQIAQETLEDYVDQIPVEGKSNKLLNAAEMTKQVSYKPAGGEATAAQIEGVDHVAKGQVFFKVNTGNEMKVVSNRDLSFSNSETKALVELAAELGNAGARNLMFEYKGKYGTAEEFAEAFNQFYDASRLQLQFEDVNGIVKSTVLPESVRKIAYEAGVADYLADLGKNDERRKANNEKALKVGEVSYETKNKKVTARNRHIIEGLAKVSGANIVVQDSVYTKDGVSTNGNYDPNTNTIYLAADAENPHVVVLSHELLHYMVKNSPYGQQFVEYVCGQLARVKGNSLEEMIQAKQDEYAGSGITLSRAQAMEEIAANATELFFNNEYSQEIINDLVSKDRTLAEKVLDFFKKLIEDIQKVLKDYEPRSNEAIELGKIQDAAREAERMFVEALQKTGESRRAAQSAVREDYFDKEFAKWSDEMQFSIKSMGEACGIDVSRDENGKVVFKIGDQLVKKVTPDHIKMSKMGALITEASRATYFTKEARVPYITKEDAENQYKAVADLMNMIIKTNDPDMVWAYAGSALFSAVKSNSDGQYGTTVDFTTICRRTQDMITAMSEAMIKKGAGLTKEEVTKLQKKLIDKGATVPCPVCYVFSRWAGAGNILDGIRDLQNKYKDFSKAEINGILEGLLKDAQDLGIASKTKSGKSKKLTGAEVSQVLASKDEEYVQVTSRIEAYENQIDKFGSDKATNDRLKELREQKKKLEIERNVLGEYSWVANVMGDPAYKPVPNNVLYNLDDGATFAKDYAPVWKYRTTRGSGAGKAIVPYADYRIGDLTLGPKNNSAIGKNGKAGNAKFEIVENGEFNDKQKRALSDARRRVKAQNLIGGQRYQSTSDFRYDYALDYVMSFFEAQALGTNIQTYTKIVEFADMIAAVGGDVNLSLMPLGMGYNSKGELQFSNVTGIDIDAALQITNKYPNAQTILVGINDRHIMLALSDDRVGFVIPFHASGASEDFTRALVENLGEEWKGNQYQSYEKVQSDNVNPDATEDQLRRKKIRDGLLKGRTGTNKWEPSAKDLEFINRQSVDITDRTFDELKEIEDRAIEGDPEAIAEYESWSAGKLNELYHKLWDKNGEYSGVRLKGSQAAAVMPHEYWDRTTTYDNAYVNGFIFRSYCYNLGLIPRFTGLNSSGNTVGYGDFTASEGYWKLLIDRPMYNRLEGGVYRDQQKINMNRFNNEMVNPSYAQENYGDFVQKEPQREVAIKAGREFVEENGEEISYSTKDNFIKQVDDELANKLDKQNALYVGEPTELLKKLGLDESPILYTKFHLHNALEPEPQGHGLTKDQVKEAVYIINNPAIIMDSLTRNDSIVIVSDKVDDKHRPIIVSIQTNGTGTYLNMEMYSNFATSIYGRNAFYDLVDRANKNGKLLYVNKTKSRSLNRMVRIQFLQLLNNVSFDTILHKSNNIVNRTQGIKPIKNSRGEYLTKEEIHDANKYDRAIKNNNKKILKELIDEAAEKAGYRRKGFHETKKENVIHIFDLERNSNASADYGTPFGIFTKSHNRNIGLGDKQVELFIKANKTLVIKDRQHIDENMPKEYRDLVKELKELDQKYGKEIEKLEDNVFDALIAYEETHPEFDSSELSIEELLSGEMIDDPDYRAAEKEYSELLTEWENEEQKIITKAKTTMTKWLKKNKYDSMELLFDSGTGNRQTDALIVLDKNQVKSAELVTYDEKGERVPLYERFNNESDDIRYSLKDTYEGDYENLVEESALQAEMNGHMMNIIREIATTDPTDRQLETLGRKILKDLNSEYDLKTFVDNMKYMIEYAKNHGDQAKAEEIARATSSMAHQILNTSKSVDDSLTKQYKDLLNHIRNTRVTISPEMRGDLDSEGGYGHFLRKNRGRMNVGPNGINVDSFFQELASMAPEFFNADEVTNEADELIKIAEVTKMLQPQMINDSHMNIEQEAQDLTYQIYEGLFNLTNKNAKKGDEAVKRINKEAYLYRKKRMELKEYMSKEFQENLQAIKEENKRLKREEGDRITQLKAAYRYQSHERAQRTAKAAESTRLLKVLRRISKMNSNPENMKAAQEMTKDIYLVAKSMSDGKRYNLERMRTEYEQGLKDGTLIKSERLENMFKDLDKEYIADMGIDGVRELLQAALELEHKMRTDNEQIDSTYKKTNHEMGLEIIQEINNSKGINIKSGASRAINKYVTMSSSSLREMRKMAGYVPDSKWELLGNQLNEGQLKMTKFQQDASKHFQEFVDKNEKWLKEIHGPKAERIKIGEANGKDVFITPAMRISLYLNSLNMGNLRHIIGGTTINEGKLVTFEGGGLKVPDLDLYGKGLIKEAYANGERVKMTEKGLKEIISKMTPKEKEYARLVHKFLDVMCKKAINDTSIKLNGYEKALVENYFPIRTDGNFLDKDFESIVHDASIEGMGMLKKRTGGVNPIMLEDVIDVVERQIKGVSKYYGLAIPVRNFNMVYGTQEMGFNTSLKESIEKKWGPTATEFMENLLADIQGSRANPSSKLDLLRGNYAGAVLTLNLSVTLKQAGSYPTAAAVVGWKPLIKALNVFNKVDRATIDKYSPLLWYRDQGNATSELADMAKTKTWQDYFPKAIQKNVFNWIQNMDSATVKRLWLAAEYYVQDQGMKKGSEEYYQEVAKVYNRIIEETQPNYTTMQRPDILRNPNNAVKMMTMFKTQSLQNFNIAADAIGEYKARHQMFKDGKITKEQMDVSSRKLANALSSQIVAAAVIGVMVKAVDLIMHKRKKLEDEEGNITWLEALKSAGQNMASTMAGSFIGGSELYDFIYKTITGEKYYGITSSNFETLTDLSEAAEGFTSEIAKAIAGESSTEKLMKKFTKLAENLSKATGIPLTNAKNLIDAGGKWIKDIQMGEFFGSDLEYGYDDLYEAIDDKEMYDKIYQNLIDQGKTEKGIQSAIGKIRNEEIKQSDDFLEAVKVKKAGGNVEAYRDRIYNKYEKYGATKQSIGTLISNAAK